MFFWNSLDILMFQRMLAIWSLVLNTWKFTVHVLLKPGRAPHPTLQINSVTVSIVFPSTCHESMGLDATTFVFWLLSFKYTFFQRGCLLLPVHSLGRTLLAFALLHSVLQGQICLLLQVFLDFLLLHSSLAGLHRTVQLQLPQQYSSGHSLGLLWYWMVCLGNEQKSFCHFWDCIQVLHFRLSCWLWWLLHFF